MPAIRTFDPALIRKYANRPGAWYTLYPTQVQWGEDEVAGPGNSESAIAEFIAERGDAPLSVYTHFPFCERQCFFCQCATVISGEKKAHRRLLEYMRREIELWADRFAKAGVAPQVRELQFGGGSPSILDEEDFAYFVDSLKLLVNFDDLVECSLEIDPRFKITPDKMDFYADMGIDRISFGIQDFDAKVMKAINRVNPPELMASFMEHPARRRFKGVNFDIIYRLPHQTLETHVRTIEQLLEFRPERTNVCQLGHRPDVFRHQRAYREEDMVSLEEAVEMKLTSVAMLEEAGYERIGFDHFAVPDDDFAVAKRTGTLHRNTMGYATGRANDIIGIGPSAISTLGPWYTQNYYMLPKYRDYLDAGQFPTIRSYRCETDDLARRRIVYDFFMHGAVDKRKIERDFAIPSFEHYFAPDIDRLGELIEDGMLVIDDDWIRLTEFGFVNPRHASEAFDIHLHGRGVSYAHSREFGDGYKSFQRREMLRV